MAPEEIIGKVFERSQRLWSQPFAVKIRTVLIQRPSHQRSAEALRQSELDVITGVMKTPGQVTWRAGCVTVRCMTCAAPCEDIISGNVWTALVAIKEPDRLLQRIAVIKSRLACIG